jgi:hypothetical protein
MEIKPEDIIITHFPAQNYSGFVVSVPKGISVYHKPSDITIECDHRRSQHQNRHDCMEILRDMLTEVKAGDIVVTGDGIAELTLAAGQYRTNGGDIAYNTGEGVDKLTSRHFVAHTELGYKYQWKKLQEKRLFDLEKDYEEKRKIIVDEIRSIEL